MSKSIPKFLYEFSISRQVDTKVTTKDPKDPSIEVTKTIKKAKPIKVAILRPRRNLFEAAEIFYAKKVADFIRDGLLPFSLVQKRYANDGGALSEPEKKIIDDLRDEVTKCKTEYFTYSPIDVSDVTKTKKNELLVKINDINSKLTSIENAYSDIFDNTAEVKARNKTIEWWVLHLSYYDPDDKEYKCVFAGETHEAKYESYDNIEDEDDPFIIEVISMCSYLISFWLTARGSLTKEELAKIEFNTMEKLYIDTVSSYRVSEDKEPQTTIKVDEGAPKEEVKVSLDPIVANDVKTPPTKDAKIDPATTDDLII